MEEIGHSSQMDSAKPQADDPLTAACGQTESAGSQGGGTCTSGESVKELLRGCWLLLKQLCQKPLALS